MKKKICYTVISILFFIASVCFMIAAVINGTKEFPPEAPAYAVYLNKYGFYTASICLMIAGAGFLNLCIRKK